MAPNKEKKSESFVIPHENCRCARLTIEVGAGREIVERQNSLVNVAACVCVCGRKRAIRDGPALER